MTTTITGAGGGHTPLQITRYEAGVNSRNIAHEITATDDVAVIFRPASYRNGTATTLFGSFSDALALLNELRVGQALELEDDDYPGLDMTFITPKDGKAAIAPDSEAVDAWLVTFDFQEITP